MTASRFRSFNKGRTAGQFRSRIEEDFADTLNQMGVEFEYETVRVGFTQVRRYRPDFIIDTPNGRLHIEVKGWFSPSDRSKLLAVRDSNPGLRLVVVLQRPQQTLSKKSRTTLAAWCDKNGIEWVPFPVPPEVIAQWIDPTPRPSPPTSPAPVVRAQMELPFTATATSSASPASG